MTTALGLSHFPARIVDGAIRFYQRSISPRKGFSCAHRVRHGGPSCSDFARHRISELGLRAGLATLPSRFRACGLAARELRASRVVDDELDGPGAQKPGDGATQSSVLQDCPIECLDVGPCCRPLAGCAVETGLQACGEAACGCLAS